MTNLERLISREKVQESASLNMFEYVCFCFLSIINGFPGLPKTWFTVTVGSRNLFYFF